ncbi:MAG: 4Fe-4S dicluster domain-containing protein [Anaerolineales bacterium]|nr:MAG: 4Fe-4S dicluster domain-containing protein [Anaerolineales bacterium]
MRKGVLVIGGNLAGVQAALDLAQSGIQIYLVEESPFLGHGNEGKVSPHLLTADMLEAVKHPNIEILTDARVADLTGQRGDFQVEVQHSPRYVDLTKCTACRDCEQVCPVTVSVNGKPRRAIFGHGYGAVPNVFAIEKRGIAPCKAACPGGIHVQGYVALITQGRFQEALDLIREAVPFPGVLGRVCHHPCEEKCRRGTEVDEPVAICALKRFVADWALSPEPYPELALSRVEGQSRRVVEGPVLSPSTSLGIDSVEGWKKGLGELGETLSALSASSKRVAIVGAGPAGLTAAYFLARQGIASEVFEALPVVGGMMAVGISGYRLPPEVLQREVAAIEALGVKIHLNHPVDRDELERLREEYDAVFVAVGTHQGWTLGIPGEDLKGVLSGVDFLRAVNLAAPGADTASPSHLGAKVVVVGGGDVAIDSARVARRACLACPEQSRRVGGQEVTVLYRRSRAEIPAEPWQVQEAEEEGIKFHYLAAPVRALGQDGVLAGLECIRMELGEPDESGRRRPVPIAGSEFTLECDTLLVAIGQTVDTPFEDLSLARRGTYVADPVTLQTDMPGVFAGGDAVSGPSSVIEAIAAGQRAAESILRYLRGEDLALGRTTEEPDLSAIEYYTPEQPVRRPRAQMPRLSLADRSSFAEVDLGFTQEQVVAEAERCLSCGVCSECLACMSACQPCAIDHSAVGECLPLDIGAVVIADSQQAAGELLSGDGIYHILSGDPLDVSAVAARAMSDMAAYRERLEVPVTAVAMPLAPPRVGVFVCRCGGQIDGVVDMDRVVGFLRQLPRVVCADDLPFSCSEEYAQVIQQAVADYRLNRVVLAACSCCSLDQVCYSCTTQRVRCKTNLGVLAADSAKLREIYADISPRFEFVNIREHCAWLHSDDPVTATAEAERLVAAAVAKASLLPPVARSVIQLDSRVLVAGDGAAAGVCAGALIAQGFAVARSEEPPSAVVGSPGRFMVTWGGNGGQRQVEADAVVLAPSEAGQLSGLRDAVGIAEPATSLTTRLTGVFVCPPDGQAEVTGAAVAARVAALLGRGQMVAERDVARVDSQRCRACGTCESICEFHAPRLVADSEPSILQPPTSNLLVSRIDPALCRGCGTCVAHCPSNAITAGYSTDEQIEAMLTAMLA